MSTIDKASLIQIPSGYKNGKLYSVKPNPTYGSELAVNGDFTTDSDWTKGNGWTIVNGEAVHTGSGDYIEQGSLVQGTKYRVVIVVTQASGSGFPQIYMGGLTTAMLSPNTYTFDITAQSGDKIKLRGLNDCKVDSISVKEILVADGDFTFARSSSATRVNSEGLIETASVLGTTEEVTNGDFATDTAWNKNVNWSISGGVAIADGTSSNDLNQGTTNAVIGKKYFISFDVVSLNQGTFFARIGGVGVVGNEVGSFSATVTATSTDRLRIIAQSNAIGTIDNVSVIEYIENDVPRLDYSGGATCASLLLEPQRTNLVTYSSDFSQSVWNKENVTITANDTTSPDGTENADTVIDSATNTRHISYLSFSGNLATERTLSVYAKQNTLRYLFLSVTNSGDSNCYSAIFDLQSGVVSATKVNGSATNSASIQSMGNGWYRCIISGTMTIGTTTFFPLIGTSDRGGFTGSLQNNNAPIYTGSGQSIYLWGAQLEEGSYATTLINTNGSTVTRTADVCNNAGTSATFNSTEGVLFAEIAALANDGSLRLMQLSDGTNNNRVSLYYDVSSNIIYSNIVVGGSSNPLSYNVNILEYLKVGVKWKENDFALWVNGTEVATDTSGSTFTANTLNDLSFNLNGIYDFYGKTKQLMVFNEALSDEELSDLTGQVNLSFNNLATFYNYTIL